MYSVQACICWGCSRSGAEKAFLAFEFILLGVKHMITHCVRQLSMCSLPLWLDLFFSATASGLKSCVIDSLFIYQERKKNERENPSSGQ